MARYPISEHNYSISQALLNALALGYDFENRAIYLFGEINDVTAYRFVAGFKWLDRTPGPIHIIMNSGGGEVHAGLAIYDAIRTAENPTIIEGGGIIASAAVPILLAGTARFLNPESYVMVHNSSWDIDTTLSTPVLKSIAEINERLNERYIKMIADRTGKSVKDVTK